MTELTIFALSSAAGRAGVAVIRVSGPSAGLIVDLLASPRPPPRKAALRTLRDPRTHDPLDRGLVLWFPAPGSFTGEDAAELHIHGGRAVVQAVLGALAAFPECRMAAPGEFTRRAFENGKLDLAEAEGLADLIAAETESQRRQAMRQSAGALSALYERWRGMLIEATALIEAAIDFADEGDVGTSCQDQARAIAASLADTMRGHLDDGHRGEIVREGFRVALTGAPNAGKSSLLNALARRDVAIVSDEPGTTRDVVEVRLDLNGWAVVVSDTAGLREATGAVEAEGIRRTLATARAADLIVWVIDPLAPVDMPPGDMPLGESDVLRVVSKSDLVELTQHEGALAVSAKTGAGLPMLLDQIGARAAERIGDMETPAITQLRHRVLIEQALEDLASATRHADTAVELAAEDFRRAAGLLGRITGRIDVEDVLDQIFGRFCIGK